MLWRFHRDKLIPSLCFGSFIVFISISVSYLNINTINRNTNINVVYMCSFFLVVDLYYFIITKGSNKFLFSKRNSINTIRFLLCWVFCFALLLLLLLCLFGIKKIPINWYIFVDFRKL